MTWRELYTLVSAMTTSLRPGGRACFAALVAAFLYHERFHTSNAVDLLARVKHYTCRKAYRKIEKFRARQRMRLESVWQWLWDNFTVNLGDCFVLVDWTRWAAGRQVLLAALIHSGRCLPYLAVAYCIKQMSRSQNLAEESFFLLMRTLRRAHQQITCLKDRGFGRIDLLQKFPLWPLHVITRISHRASFQSEKFQGLLKDFRIAEGQLRELGVGLLGTQAKHQVEVRLIVYRGPGHKAAWFIATDRMDLTAEQVVRLSARRMGIEAGFRDLKGTRDGWGLRKIKMRSDVELSVLWAAAMVAYALRMAAGAVVCKQDNQAMFSWTRKGPRRSLLAVGRNAVTSGMLKPEQ